MGPLAIASLAGLLCVPPSQEYRPFLNLTFKPFEPFDIPGALAKVPGSWEGGGDDDCEEEYDDEEEEAGKHHPAFQHVPRDNVSIELSGIEVAMAQEVVVRILKFGQELTRTRKAGAEENTNLSGAEGAGDVSLQTGKLLRTRAGRLKCA